MIKKVKKGFTLIELVVVIAVIAILSAVSVVAYVGITNNAKKSVAEQEASSLKKVLTAELTRSNYEFKDYVVEAIANQAALDAGQFYTINSTTNEYELDKTYDAEEIYYKSQLEYTFSYDFENDIIEYSRPAGLAADTNQAKLKLGLQELLNVAQGYGANETAKSSYIVAEEASGSQFGITFVDNKLSNKLILVHTNEQRAVITGFAQKA